MTVAVTVVVVVGGGGDGGGDGGGGGGDGGGDGGEGGGGVSGWRALATSFRFFVAFFTVARLGSSSSGETGGAFTSWHAVHVVFRPGSPALSNLSNARTVCVCGPHGKAPRRGTRAGVAPASRARVDGLRTLATLVRVGRRVHEHAVLRMLAIRERRLSRRRSRLAAAAHAQHAQVRQEEAHAGSRCVCSPRSGVLVEHGGPCRHASPRSSAGELLRAKEGGTQRPDAAKFNFNL